MRRGPTVYAKRKRNEKDGTDKWQVDFKDERKKTKKEKWRKLKTKQKITITKSKQKKVMEEAKNRIFSEKNKAGYTATPVVCGWAGAVLEKVTRAFGQEQ